jgi:hypothetical protein
MGVAFVVGVLVLGVGSVFAAYHHMGEEDSTRFVHVYPELAGSKLDSCALCHSGGQVVQGSRTVSYGSCQWCHYKYGYDASGPVDETMNAYGRAFRDQGRNEAAVAAIENLDSDGDGYTNKAEIDALRFPGDAGDDPGKTIAPFKVYSRADLEALPQHTQFILMNAHKSTDFYAEYKGVALEDLLNDAGMLASATGIKVYAPDGWSQYHPLTPDPDPLLYHVIGDYPAASYYHDDAAAYSGANPPGWCEYTSPRCATLTHGDSVDNTSGLKLILAFLRDGSDLTPGVLTPSNKLDGEGPYRVVPPQKVPGPPDQRSTAADQAVIWPFDNDADHNAGFSTRSVTIIKVEPLPPGTTDIDTLEAGWKYVDEGKIMIYGAIDPTPVIQGSMNGLAAAIEAADASHALKRGAGKMLRNRLKSVNHQIARGQPSRAARVLQTRLMRMTDGCQETGKPHRHDWVTDCAAQDQIYWSLMSINNLLNIQ